MGRLQLQQQVIEIHRKFQVKDPLQDFGSDIKIQLFNEHLRSVESEAPLAVKLYGILGEIEDKTVVRTQEGAGYHRGGEVDAVRYFQHGKNFGDRQVVVAVVVQGDYDVIEQVLVVEREKDFLGGPGLTLSQFVCIPGVSFDTGDRNAKG